MPRLVWREGIYTACLFCGKFVASYILTVAIPLNWLRHNSFSLSFFYLFALRVFVVLWVFLFLLVFWCYFSTHSHRFTITHSHTVTVLLSLRFDSLNQFSRGFDGAFRVLLFQFVCSSTLQIIQSFNLYHSQCTVTQSHWFFTPVIACDS